MPPACTPEKHFDAQENISEDRYNLLGYVTPPRPTSTYADREDQHVKWITKKFPKLTSLFHVHQKIGEGTFSSVYMANLYDDANSLRSFAIKHLVPTMHPKRIEVELQCLKRIGGEDNVVGLDFCLRENDNIVFVMPYLQHEPFMDYVFDMDSSECAFYMKNLLKAVRRVHSFGIIHRDIKPNNFLYDRKNKKFLLIDFGLAQHCKTSMDNINRSNKRKRDDNSNYDSINEETACEPPVKRKALQNKNMCSLNSTILHLTCSTECNGRSSKENAPSCNEMVEPVMLNTPSKQTKKKNCNLLRKSPFKFPGLDLPNTHSKMTNHKLKVNAAAVNIANDRGTHPNNTRLKSNKSAYCKCYGKPSFCTVCLLRKGQEAARAGTPGFRPPEVLLKYNRQNTAVDIWAVGIIMLCILSGTYPFFRAPDDITALAEMITIFGDEPMKKVAKIFGRHLICSEKRPTLDIRKICCNLRARGSNINKSSIRCQHCSYYMHNCVCVGTPLTGVVDPFPDSAYDLLQRLLDINPYTRITAEEALKHPFLSS